MNCSDERKTQKDKEKQDEKEREAVMEAEYNAAGGFENWRRDQNRKGDENAAQFLVDEMDIADSEY